MTLDKTLATQRRNLAASLDKLAGSAGHLASELRGETAPDTLDADFADVTDHFAEARRTWRALRISMRQQP